MPDDCKGEPGFLARWGKRCSLDTSEATGLHILASTSARAEIIIMSK
jgi:hypothetical protein